MLNEENPTEKFQRLLLANDHSCTHGFLLDFFDVLLDACPDARPAVDQITEDNRDVFADVPGASREENIAWWERIHVVHGQAVVDMVAAVAVVNPELAVKFCQAALPLLELRDHQREHEWIDYFRFRLMARQVQRIIAGALAPQEKTGEARFTHFAG